MENLHDCPNLEQNPTKTLRWSAPSSLIVVTVLYILVNVAYFSVASREDILSSKQIAAAVFFQNVFGTGGAARALNVLICLSAFGNLVAVLINSSRLLRETGRLVSITRLFSPSLLRSYIDFPMFIDKVSFLIQSSGPIQNHSERLWVLMFLYGQQH